MTEPAVRTDYSRGEVVAAMVWLGIGALVSLLLEVVYLSARVGSVPVPATVLVALAFNVVLTRTARLWARGGAWIAFVPLAVWLGGFFALMFVLPAGGPQLVPDNILTLLLLFAGILGGVFPMLRAK